MSAVFPRVFSAQATHLPGRLVPGPVADWTPERLRAAFDLQRAARWTVSQTDARQRAEVLGRLQGAVKAHRVQLAGALAEDLGKSRAAAEITEIHPLLDELKFVRSRLAGWMQPRRVPGVPNLGMGRSEVQREARGVTLILSPWNYPLNLALAPLVGALAAGNTAIIKPSEKTPATSALLRALIAQTFPPSLVEVIEGDADVAQALLRLPFDHVFFTGSSQVGRKVMAAAAQMLGSVTLELGGKSPAIVDAGADLKLAARRVAWGKFINAGQTCVAPDYVLVHESVADDLERLLPAAIEAQYGDAARQRTVADYGRIIGAAGVARLRELTETSVAAGARVLYGGEFDEARRYVSPTLVTGVRPDMPLMREEIFGPVLPLLRYRQLDEALHLIRTLPKPLALYLFSSDAATERRVRQETTSGSLVIDGTVVQFVHPHLPFGGVGASGQGSYHGEYGFRAFSHERAVLREPGYSPTPSLYPPFGRILPRLTGWALRKLNE